MNFINFVIANPLAIVSFALATGIYGAGQSLLFRIRDEMPRSHKENMLIDGKILMMIGIIVLLAGFFFLNKSTGH